MNYPNLIEIITYHPYHVSTFANFAEVTGELLQEVLKGQEELSLGEIYNISKYAGLSMSVLMCPKLIKLDFCRYRHRTMINELLERARYIQRCQENGSHAADVFMKYDVGYIADLRRSFVDDKATYGQYIGARERVNQCLSFISSEKRKKKVRTVSKRGIS
ncbi:hypothetical protein LAD12857_00710 [Lacrimispora amygdalina]|uniref:Uncharacterized protein n=1 Tax=Lacrimispora amygdalina TaxID=253257 RepID=A0ABQ5LZF6_9FIRM